MFQIQGLFASRETVDEVIEYAAAIGKANGDGPGTMTCTMLMYNTVARLANERIAELEAKLARYEADDRFAVVWCVEDVKTHCDWLTDEQAARVLERLEANHDCTIGINWGVISDTACLLYGDEGSKCHS